MALPNKIDSATPADTELLSLGDDRIRELKQAILDILGIPDNVLINNALFEVVAEGLRTILLRDAGTDPTVAGQLRRVGNSLRYHDGAAARSIVPFALEPYTQATLPPPGIPGRLALVTDGGAAGSILIDDGGSWRCDAEKSQKVIVVTCPPYNADPTGTTDSTAAFIAAHDALPPTGGVIFIPAGTYLFNQTSHANQFTITKSNVTVMGVGWATQLKSTTTGPFDGVQGIIFVRPQAGTTVSNIRIANLRITGPTPNTGAEIPEDNLRMGVLIGDGTENGDITDVLVEGVLVENMNAPAFGIDSGATTAVRRIKFSRCWARAGRGVGFNSFSGRVFDLTIQDCFATDLDGFGMEMGNSGGMSLIGNTILRTGQSGIGIEYNNEISPMHYVLIQGNYIADIGTPAYPDASGISLGQAANPVNTAIIGNIIARTGGHGIVINLSPSRITIKDNVIEDVGRNGVFTNGITATGTITGAHIVGNTIRRTGAGYALTYGVALAGPGDASNLVAYNDVQGATIAKIDGNAPTRLVRGTPPLFSFNWGGVGNVGAVETDLMSLTLPARALDVDRQTVRITAWGRTAANANTKRVRLYVGDAMLLDTTAIAANDKAWRLSALYTRVNYATGSSVAWGDFNGALIQTNTIPTIGGRDFTVPIVVKLTGQGIADNDVIQDGMMIEFLDTH